MRRDTIHDIDEANNPPQLILTRNGYSVFGFYFLTVSIIRDI